MGVKRVWVSNFLEITLFNLIRKMSHLLDLLVGTSPPCILWYISVGIFFLQVNVFACWNSASKILRGQCTKNYCKAHSIKNWITFAKIWTLFLAYFLRPWRTPTRANSMTYNDLPRWILFHGTWTIILREYSSPYFLKLYSNLVQN